MYKMLLVLFVIILVLSITGFIKYGVNIVFLYILLFSLIVIVWSVVAIMDKRKEGGNGEK